MFDSLYYKLFLKQSFFLINKIPPNIQFLNFDKKIGRFDYFVGLIVVTVLELILLYLKNEYYQGQLFFKIFLAVGILSAILAIIYLTILRLNDLKLSPLYSIILFIPGIQGIFILFLLIKKGVS